MKIKGFLKILGLTFMIFVFLICFSVTGLAFAEKTDLPEVERWMNGAALSAEGNYLSDTWAIDKTNISEYKYVLINQGGTEEMRIKNYPDDIYKGNTTVAPTYMVDFKLTVPEEITNEVVITIENDSAVYSLSFNQENDFSQFENFYQGEYKISDIEATGSENFYRLKDDLTLKVSDKALSLSLELVEDTEAKNNGSASDENSVLKIVKSIDSNGDLLWDTVKLLLAIVLLFVVYIIILRRRKKSEEINR